MALALAIALIACDDPPDGPVDLAVPTDATAELDDVKLGFCTNPFSGACGRISVPLDWSAHEGKTISIYVDQIATVAQPRAQIWLLQGGPGSSGADMVPLGRALARAAEVEVYTLDHRGVGLSAKLDCNFDAITDGGAVTEGAFWAACLDAVNAMWSDAELKQFTTSNAARDLHAVIERMRRPDLPVYVYGASYGTYWAQRFLSIYPSGADAVILDSIVPMDGMFLSQTDQNGNELAQKLATICKADASCSEQLGADPLARVQSIVEKMKSHHCAQSPIQWENRGLLTGFLTNWWTQVYAFAALVRYERCTEADVAALQFLFEAANAPYEDKLFSAVLYSNVTYSELWEEPAPSQATLQARYEAALFPSGVHEFEASRVLWPVYPHDEYVRHYATSTVPMLMMNGTLDAQTTIERAQLVVEHYNAPHQTFITIPNANHGVMWQSPMIGSQGEFETQCGFAIMTSFLADPKAPPDTSCLGQLAPFVFADTIGNAPYLFGTTSLWSGPPVLTRDQHRLLPPPPHIHQAPLRW